jgi:hypothetical protein
MGAALPFSGLWAVTEPLRRGCVTTFGDATLAVHLSREG